MPSPEYHRRGYYDYDQYEFEEEEWEDEEYEEVEQEQEDRGHEQHGPGNGGRRGEQGALLERAHAPVHAEDRDLAP